MAYLILWFRAAQAFPHPFGCNAFWRLQRKSLRGRRGQFLQSAVWEPEKEGATSGTGGGTHSLFCPPRFSPKLSYR